MVLDVVPAAIIASETLEGVGRIGAAVQLTMYQKELKKSWKALSQCTLGSKDYRTDIARWTCQCGSQQLQAHHLCKHLVQSMNASAGFFTELTRRQTMPIYENTLLGNSISDSEGSISAGDDFFWMGRHSDLSRGKWRLVIRSEAPSGIATSSRWSCSASLECVLSPNKKVIPCFLCWRFEH